MTIVDDEKFFAWLDGELAPEESARVAAEVAADPWLARLADEHSALKAGLSGAFATVAAAPVPEPIAKAARAQPGEVVDLAKAREERTARRSMPLWRQAAAMAATLALGIAAGNMLAGAPSSPIEPEAGRLVAGGSLEEALYARLASAPADEGPRIGLTFRDKSGSYCRTFEDGSASGLACREGGDWLIRGLVQDGQGQATDYRMAAGTDPRLMDMVDEAIAGEPLDADQEKAARDADWRP